MPRDLNALGISARSEAAFRFLTRFPRSSVSDVATELGLSMDACRSVLGELIDQELISQHPTARPARFSPLDPEPVLSAKILEAEAALDDGRQTLANLAEAFRRSAVAGDAASLVDLVIGAENVEHRYNALFASVTTEFAGFDCPPYLHSDPSDEIGRERVVFDRKVVGRIIYRQDAFDIPGRYDVVSQLVEMGEQARVWSGVPGKLFIFDRAIALIPLNLDDNRAPTNSIVVRPSGLLDLIIALFEYSWRQATPFRGAPTTVAPEPTSSQRVLVDMLIAGFTDQQIAKQLKISARTLARRVEALHAQEETETRFQLGYALAMRGAKQPTARRRNRA